MALQFGYGIAKFGGLLYIPKLVALSILREMGPVFTSLLVAARVGSGITAEVGSMTVTQQVDAMRALGTSPIRRIVVPRVLALLIGLPILTLIVDVIALFSAMIVSGYEFNINYEFFFYRAIETVWLPDLLTGLAKTVVFAFFIAICSCWKGLNTKGGTIRVGEATTWSVVMSCIFIMISDFFLSKLFFVLIYPKY